MAARRLPNRVASATLAVVLALGFVGLTAAPAQAATLNVTDESSLRAAITAAADGDVIEFDGPAATIILTQNLPVLDNSVTVNGNGWRVDGNSGGATNAQGFLVQNATVEFNNIEIYRMEWYGIRVDNATVTVRESDLRGTNSVAWDMLDGAILADDNADITVIDSEFVGNSEGVNTFDYVENTHIRMSGSHFWNNTGAVSGKFHSGSLEVSDSLVERGAYGVSFIAVDDSVLRVTDSYLDTGTNMHLNLTGATVEVAGSSLVSGPIGVRLDSSGGASVTFTDTEFLWHSGRAVDFVAGARDTTLSFINCVFEENDDITMVGTVSDLLIKDSVFHDNGGSSGLATLYLHAAGDVRIEGSTFTNNTGSPLAVHTTMATSHVVVENSTFSASGRSAIHHFEGEGLLDLHHSTVTASTGGGVAVQLDDAVNADISHTIIAGNAGDSDLGITGASTANVEWSAMGSVADTSTGGGYVEGSGVLSGVIDPMLAPIGDNGGPTQTHPPLVGSPVIDAGNPAIVGAPALDQRGFSRIAGPAIDIGAVEAASAPPVLVAPTVSDPIDTTVDPDEAATFSVTATGIPSPVVTWEVSLDGSMWEHIHAYPGVVLSADGLTLTTVATYAHNGRHYRATAENSAGADVSEPAVLTVNPPTVPAAPVIGDPGDVTVGSGVPATFHAWATGFPVPVVTWEVSLDGSTWLPISADTAATVATDGSSVTVVTSDAHNGYRYRATATNSEGSDVSEPALLTVTPVVVPIAPSVGDPDDLTVNSGATATFDVGVAGAPLPVVTWEVSMDGSTWLPISADTAATVATDGLSVTVATTDTHTGYRYRATATNTVGSVVSEPATLTVNPLVVPIAPTLSDPANAFEMSGGHATFEVTAAGVPAPVVTWEVSMDGSTWLSITADTAATVAVNGRSVTVITTDAHDGYLYRATATNSEGTYISAPALLTVFPVPATISDPVNVTVEPGAVAMFQVRAMGFPGPVVTWEVSEDAGVTWSAVTDPAATVTRGGMRLEVVTTDAHDGLWYRATATNTSSSATSNPAVLTVTTSAAPAPSDSLVNTGNEVPTTVVLTAALALLFGGALFAMNIIARRRAR